MASSSAAPKRGASSSSKAGAGNPSPKAAAPKPSPKAGAKNAPSKAAAPKLSPKVQATVAPPAPTPATPAFFAPRALLHHEGTYFTEADANSLRDWQIGERRLLRLAKDCPLLAKDLDVLEDLRLLWGYNKHVI